MRHTPNLRKLYSNLEIVLTDLIFFFRTFWLIRPRLKSFFQSTSHKIQHAGRSEVVVVPLMEMNHHQHIHVLIMAKSFQLRGHKVVVVICDEYMPACEIKSSRNNSGLTPCFRCTTSRTKTLDLYGLPYFKLSELFAGVDDVVKYGAKVAESAGFPRQKLGTVIEDSVTRHFYGAEVLASQCDVQVVRSRHESTALISLAAADLIYKRCKPTICFNNMNVYSVWGPFFDFMSSKGVAPIVLSQTAFNLDAVRLNNADLFKHKRTYKRFLDARGGKSLSPGETLELDSFIQKRMIGNDDLMKEWGYFHEHGNAQLIRSSDKKNVFLFPNIPWDQGIDEFTGCFSTVLDWVEKTIEHFANHSSINIWIKPHPAEVKGTARSEKSVAEFIKMKYPVLPENVYVIDAEQGISPYSLFSVIDLGVVLTGTLGLEMALNNVPVVSAGVNPCHGMGLLSEPETVEDYFSFIESGDVFIPNSDELRLFSYFYFIHQCFKWPITERVWGDVNFNASMRGCESLCEGRSRVLDIIFDEIFALKDDFVRHK